MSFSFSANAEVFLDTMEDNLSTQADSILEGAAIDDVGVDELRRFTLWASATLNLHIEQEDTDVFVLEIPEPHRQEFGNVAELRLRFAKELAPVTSSVERITAGSPLIAWLIACLKRLGIVTHAAPVDQPVGVHEIAPRLFSAYTVDGGKIQLKGCSLDDHPLLRLSYLSTSQSNMPGAGGEPLIHVFVNKFGKPVDEKLQSRLHLDRIGPVTRMPRDLGRAQTEELIAAGRAIADQRLPDAAYSLACATLVWCKYATGKLAISFGEESVDLVFAGWAQMIADGTTKPPRFTCKQSGLKSYHITATDDGRITVAEAIGECCESHERVLKVELETCAATGKQALPRFFVECPVSRKRVLQSALVVCGMCRQAVSPATLENGRCSACRGLTVIAKDEPRLARILGEYPALDSWRNWQLAETATVYVLVASALLKRLIVVLDKQSLEPLHLATASRWRSAPRPIESSRWNEYLGTRG